MHEMSLVHDVLDTVINQAEMAQANKVLSVHMTVGDVHDIVDDLFVKCFAYLGRGTIAADAQMKIARIPLTVRCTDCNHVQEVNIWAKRGPVECPACGSGRYSINSGEEFLVDDIEVA